MHRKLGLQEWTTASPCLLCLTKLLRSPRLSSLASPNHQWFTLPFIHILTHRTHPPFCSLVPVPPMPISAIVELFIMALQSFSWVKTLLVTYTCFVLTFHSFVWSHFVEPKRLPWTSKSSPARKPDPSEQRARCFPQGIFYTSLGCAVTVKETQSIFAIWAKCGRKCRALGLEAWGPESKRALSPLYTHDYNGLSVPARGI